MAPDEILGILDEARAAGADTLDTAIAYGDSERRLGEAGVLDFRIVSKLPEMPEAQLDAASWVEESVRSSLVRLGVSKLHGLLLHQPDQLLGETGEELFAALAAVREGGLVDKIGVSVYRPEQLDRLVARYAFGMVQVPLSAIDRRMITSGWLERLHGSGLEVHVRSIFLQGLLVMDPTKRPRRFDRWRHVFDAWHRWLATTAWTPVQACVAYCASQPEVDRVVVGVENRQQLREVLAGFDVGRIAPPAALASDDPHLVDPRKWDPL